MDATDLKLLELAGKAAGESYDAGRNPLQDDALALRLAVKLYMNVFQAANSAYALPSDDDGAHEEKVRYLDAGNDPTAATRRAIVLVAAEIGLSIGA